MKTLQQALDIILAAAQPLANTQRLNISQALGHYLAEDVVSPLDVPPQDNSAMDGYAINLGDSSATSGTTQFEVTQTINAGHIGQPLLPNQAARIFTGAEIPAGANCVAMQENCTRSDDGQWVTAHSTALGDNIRRRGQDITVGNELFNQGHRLTAVDIGLLASLGRANITVYRPPKIAILSTGDELKEPGQALGPGQIYNSNRYLLTAALQALQCEVVDLGQVEDTLAATQTALIRGQEADLIVSTGGVSVGEADFVKTAVERLGELNSWKIAIKPGKPLAFGRIGDTPFLGLPGNPVAVFVTFLLVVKPFLNALRGNNSTHPLRVFSSGFDIKRPSDRRQYMRIKIDQTGLIQRFGNQSSGVLSSLAWAEGLAIVETGQTVNKGDALPVILLNDHQFS
ncbi:molybdopterin molybdotransferase MoeA [Halioxenophilus aromaticivorans]|uniref:Molybdopterin molybdenumtransferase n=1 Tax=Halioxenophilus aromaticivorans TaxID=1306992 RepID=A0AAV3UAH2_9ALTE